MVMSLSKSHSLYLLTSKGSVPLRLEVRDLQQNYPDQWNLYLLGLQAFYKLDETSDLSYYGIAGMYQALTFSDN
jgi:hypothetical protein